MKLLDDVEIHHVSGGGAIGAAIGGATGFVIGAAATGNPVGAVAGAVILGGAASWVEDQVDKALNDDTKK